MRQIVGSLDAPLPTFDTYPVPAAAGQSDVGFLVVAVPRSPSAPHAVLVNGALRYPRRNGTTTYYLSEPEVAQAYQARAAGLAARLARLDDAWNRGVARLRRDGRGWLALALVPQTPGAMRMDRPCYLAFQQRWGGKEPYILRNGSQFSATSIDQGLLHADGGGGDDVDDWLSLDMHADGSGFFASVVGVARDRMGQPSDEVLVNDQLLSVAVLSGLNLLAEHARDTAASSGTALLRATIYPVSNDQPVQLGYTWKWCPPPTVPVLAPPRLTTSTRPRTLMRWPLRAAIWWRRRPTLLTDSVRRSGRPSSRCSPTMARYVRASSRVPPTRCVPGQTETASKCPRAPPSVNVLGRTGTGLPLGRSGAVGRLRAPALDGVISEPRGGMGVCRSRPASESIHPSRPARGPPISESPGVDVVRDESVPVVVQSAQHHTPVASVERACEDRAYAPLRIPWTGGRRIGQ